MLFLLRLPLKKTNGKRVCKARRYGGGDHIASTQPADLASSVSVSQLDISNFPPLLSAHSTVPTPNESDQSDVLKLKAEVNELKKSVQSLTTQINFLLSFVGAVDFSGVSAPSSSEEGVPIQAGGSYAEVSRQPAAHTSGVGAGVSVSRVSIRDAAVTAMYMDKAESDRREASFIVSGLPISNSASDRECVSNLIESQFGARPVVNFTKRLGQRSSDKVQLLLVYLKDVAHAQHIVSHARQLRQSQNELVRRTVYINKNLTKAAARAAYELRCRRRQAAGRQSALFPGVQSTQQSSQQSQHSPMDVPVPVRSPTALRPDAPAFMASGSLVPTTSV